MSALDRMLGVARRELGTVEGPGPNQVRYNSAYYNSSRAYGPTYAWCQVFIWWCAIQGGVNAVFPSKTAWTPSAAGWYQQRERWGRTPRVGAHVFYDWNGRIIAHTGIVEHVYADGSFIAIEGNTDVAGGGSGGRVMRQRRRAGSIGRHGGFGYPDYAAIDRVGGGVVSAAPAQVAGGGSRRPDSLPVLKVGVKAEWVSLAQQCLGVRADWEFGPATQRAVLAQQARYGLERDGVIGPWTWVSFVADAGEDLSIGEAKGRPGVEVLQNMLGLRGGDLDREFGPATAERVREVQRWAGITADGEVGPATRGALVRG